VPALVWRIQFPPDITEAVRHNRISNSDVEKFAWFVSACEVDIWVPHSTAGMSVYYGSDNSPTVGWHQRQAARAESPAPQRFIQASALLHKFGRRGPADTEHWAGRTNLMADFASRSFDEGFPSSQDHAFLTEFSHRFPLPPQLGSWTLVQPRAATTSVGFSYLRGQPADPMPQPPPSGKSGISLPPRLAKIHGSPGFRPPANTWNDVGCSWPLLKPCGTVCPTMYDRLLARKSRLRFSSSDSLWTRMGIVTPVEPRPGNHDSTRRSQISLESPDDVTPYLNDN
jgi:hypothetical protein